MAAHRVVLEGASDANVKVTISSDRIQEGRATAAIVPQFEAMDSNGGVARALKQAFGARGWPNGTRPAPLGSVFVIPREKSEQTSATAGYEHYIHVVVPSATDVQGPFFARNQISTALLMAFKAAEHNKLTSLALPFIGVGRGMLTQTDFLDCFATAFFNFYGETRKPVYLQQIFLFTPDDTLVQRAQDTLLHHSDKNKFKLRGPSRSIFSLVTGLFSGGSSPGDPHSHRSGTSKNVASLTAAPATTPSVTSSRPRSPPPPVQSHNVHHHHPTQSPNVLQYPAPSHNAHHHPAPFPAYQDTSDPPQYQDIADEFLSLDSEASRGQHAPRQDLHQQQQPREQQHYGQQFDQDKRTPSSNAQSSFPSASLPSSSASAPTSYSHQEQPTTVYASYADREGRAPTQPTQTMQTAFPYHVPYQQPPATHAPPATYPLAPSTYAANQPAAVPDGHQFADYGHQGYTAHPAPATAPGAYAAPNTAPYMAPQQQQTQWPGSTDYNFQHGQHGAQAYGSAHPTDYRTPENLHATQLPHGSHDMSSPFADPAPHPGQYTGHVIPSASPSYAPPLPAEAYGHPVALEGQATRGDVAALSDLSVLHDWLERHQLHVPALGYFNGLSFEELTISELDFLEYDVGCRLMLRLYMLKYGADNAPAPGLLGWRPDETCAWLMNITDPVLVPVREALIALRISGPALVGMEFGRLKMMCEQSGCIDYSLGQHAKLKELLKFHMEELRMPEWAKKWSPAQSVTDARPMA